MKPGGGLAGECRDRPLPSCRYASRPLRRALLAVSPRTPRSARPCAREGRSEWRRRRRGLPAELQFVVGAGSLAGESCCRKQEGDGAQSEDQFHGGPPCLKLSTTNDWQSERVSQVSLVAPLFWQPQ